MEMVTFCLIIFLPPILFYLVSFVFSISFKVLSWGIGLMYLQEVKGLNPCYWRTERWMQKYCKGKLMVSRNSLYKEIAVILHEKLGNQDQEQFWKRDTQSLKSFQISPPHQAFQNVVKKQRSEVWGTGHTYRQCFHILFSWKWSLK